jgi:isopenicillin N synthase-like dioxygenase
LQLLTKAGEWKQVVVPEGYLIVNTAEQLEFITAGHIQATLHRVQNPGGQYARQDRYATIFFASLASDFKLNPYPNCIEWSTAGMDEAQKNDYLKKYPRDVTVMENLLSRLIEMGTISNPDKDLITSLQSKGLLRQPPEKLKVLHPDLF